MMSNLFINSENEYPRHIGDIKLVDPNCDDTNLPAGWKKVIPTEMPTCSNNETVEELYPKLISGEYYQSWKVRVITDEELKSKEEFLEKYRR